MSLLVDAIRILSTMGPHHSGDSSSHHHDHSRRRRTSDGDDENDDGAGNGGSNGVSDGRRGNRWSSSSSSPLIPGLPDDIALNCLALAGRSDHGSLACLNARFRSLIKSGYLYELRRRMDVAENWVYLVCDPREWEAFDPGANRWMRLPRIPCDDCFNHADKESLAVGPHLLVFGRELRDFAVWTYRSVGLGRGRGWSRCCPMNRPRCLFASASSGSIAIVAGGSDKTGAVLGSAELYDVETGCWELLPAMHAPRKLCSGFFMGGKFYVVGGMSGNREPLTCGEEYDLQSRRWRRIEGMYPTASDAAGAPPLVAVVDDQLYAVEYRTNRLKRYDEERRSWAAVGRLPVRADTSNGWGLAFKACGRELLVVGGQRGPEGESIVLSSWRPGGGGAAPEWKVLGVKEHAGVFVYNCAIMGC
ncbi:F-box/kelch-repeat protein At5g60570-like [Phoenix dactylifera]|uniref:F-box/kelch-repeat protein At5g60570-like n=1 Tax=Phoenix dactylifera TaxID=42345 RepID=A0A8B7C4D9_PHODC|nr:F-box/kelch-repeat protein At5g60570-like [Phoenix dactylifera]